MQLYQPIIPARYTKPLLDYLKLNTGNATQQALAAAGLDDERLQLEDAALTMEEFDLLMRQLHLHTGKTDLGFELGLHIHLSTHGALGHAMSTCSTLSELLTLACRFSKLMTPSFIIKHKRGTVYHELIWRPAAGMSTMTLHYFYELHVSSLNVLLHSVLGDRILPYESKLPIHKPPHIGRYRELKALKVQFDSSSMPEVRTLIPRAMAELRLDETLRAGAPTVDDLYKIQSSLATKGSWSDWVSLVLREAEGHQPTQAELAELMDVSAHTLARKLKHEGFNFRELALKIRHQRALAMIESGRMTLEQIAYRLGYEQASNFTHAFKKIEGVSPSYFKLRAQ